jgi:hypothetical protein
MRNSWLLCFAALAIGCTAHNGHGGGDGGSGGGGSPDLGSSDGGGDRGGDGGVGGADMSAPGVPAFSVVITIVLENHDYAEVIGNTTDAPYLNSLLDPQSGIAALATNYMDSGAHPSLPNYLTLISGDPQGLSKDVTANQIAPFKSDNLGNQLEQAKIPWRSYQESMDSPCQLSDSQFGLGNYATKHDPFVYFDNIQNGPNMLCANTNVTYSQFAADLAAGSYKYMWITPNLFDDGHGGPLGVVAPPASLKASDDWCKTEIQKIVDSPLFKAGGVIFLTWDEAEGRTRPGQTQPDSRDQVPMIIISPKLTKKTSANAYSHKSYLATVEDIFKLPLLGTVAGAPSMMEFFQ